MGSTRTAQPTPASAGRTRSTKAAPASSLSGQMITVRPARGRQSVLAGSALAPPMAVVAATPARASASAHFSPSTSTTVSAPAIWGRRYSGRGSGIRGSPAALVGRKVFFGLPVTGSGGPGRS